MPRLARMAALLAATIVLATPAGPVVSAAGAMDGPTFPPYVLFKGMGFDITSNGAWHGVNGTSGVRDVEPYNNPSHRGGDPSYGIWTPTCTPGQKFSVARTVDLLGPPQSVTFDFVRSMWVASTAVVVNDRLASKSLGNNTPPDLSPAGSGAGTGPLAFFHPGMNKLQVVVTVASTRTACKTYRFTLASDEKGQKDITVTIEFESSSVTYNYRPA